MIGKECRTGPAEDLCGVVVPNGCSLLFPGEWEGDGVLRSLISLCMFCS